MAPLQKRALITFLIGLVFSAALAVVLVLEGDPAAFEDSEFIRWITYIALVGVPLSYLLLIDFSLRKPTELDERDRLIMLRSGSVQWLAIAFALAGWTVGLTEVYWDTGEVPVAFLSLIFISVLIVSVLARSLGILLGYWRTAGNA
jgi:hypothetical protein